MIPALKPKCYSFYEVGPQFIHGQTQENLIEVSADGIIECPVGPTCSNKKIADPHKHIVVEAKCMYPSTIPQNFHCIPYPSDMSHKY